MRTATVKQAIERAGLSRILSVSAVDRFGYLVGVSPRLPPYYAFALTADYYLGWRTSTSDAPLRRVERQLDRIDRQVAAALAIN